MVIGSNQRLHSFSEDQINNEIDTKLITKVKEAKSLGVIIDEHLSWSNHIGELSKKISSAIGALACVASVSVGFPHKFRCFGRAKIGARAKKKEGGGGEEKRKRVSFSPPIFARPKHRNLRGNPRKRLLRRL